MEQSDPNTHVFSHLFFMHPSAHFDSVGSAYYGRYLNYLVVLRKRNAY